MKSKNNKLSTVIKYDYITKYNKKIKIYSPKVIKIVLTFDIKNSTNIDLISSCLALELITKQKPYILLNKANNKINLKIKSGVPIGCKVTLRKNAANNFLFSMFWNKFPIATNFDKSLYIGDNIHQNTVHYSYNNLSSFSFINDNYNLFKYLNKLNISIITNSKDSNVTLFITNALKIPTKKSYNVC